MRTSTAYFAGVGTVIVAVVAGLGGGVVISNIVSPHAPRTEMSKLELRMSERPIPAANAVVGTGKERGARQSRPRRRPWKMRPHNAPPCCAAAASRRTRDASGDV